MKARGLRPSASLFSERLRQDLKGFKGTHLDTETGTFLHLSTGTPSLYPSQSEADFERLC